MNWWFVGGVVAVHLVRLVVLGLRCGDGRAVGYQYKGF
jgi:hypothetical protein